MRDAEVRVGTAAWAIPRGVRERFDDEGSRLERYARRFACVEINSSFYRPHRPSTYARWAASVPDGFRFALKVPKEITHTRRFVGRGEAAGAFLAETRGTRRQARRTARAAAAELRVRCGAGPTRSSTAVRARYAGVLACEPRHPTWFTNEAERRADGARGSRASRPIRAGYRTRPSRAAGAASSIIVCTARRARITPRTTTRHCTRRRIALARRHRPGVVHFRQHRASTRRPRTRWI